MMEWPANCFNPSTFDSTKLHERSAGIQSQVAVAVVTMDTDMVTSLRDQVMRRRIPNNVERGKQTA